MLRKSLSTNRVVKTKAIQCLRATTGNISIPITNTTRNSFASSTCGHCQYHHQYHSFTSSTINIRFMSTSPFTSLKRHRENSNQTNQTPHNNIEESRNNHRNDNRTNNRNRNRNSSNNSNNSANNGNGAKKGPWKHFNIPKASKKQGEDGNNSHRNNRNRHKKEGTANYKSGQNQQREQQIRPIDKLRDSFMESLQSDRQRRQNQNHQELKPNHNTNSNKNKKALDQSLSTTEKSSGKNFVSTESRLDQLLRMSRQRSKTNHYGSNYDNNNNYNNKATKSGAKAFRERRKLQQQQQQQQQKQQKYERYQTIQSTNALQQELVRSNATALNHEITNDNQNAFSINDEEDKVIILPRKDLTLVELSSLLRVHKDKIVKILHSLGESVPKALLLTSSTASDDTETYKIDVDMAELIALELGLDPQRANRTNCQFIDAERRILRKSDDENDDVATIGDNDDMMSMEELPTRPPVVCIMGHVDHGKTTLMDCLRQRALEASTASGKKKKKKVKKKKGKKKSSDGQDGINRVAGTEAGGITQTVSAFQVALPTTLDSNDNEGGSENKAVDKVTFLDTPGHAAFKAMRQSGSNGADVIVLVVAADDGVSPQTVEIIDMYKSIAKSQPGSISLVVAMTKIDKPGINVDESLMMVENQLMEHEIFSENLSNVSDMEFGGVQVIPVSGLTGEGLDELIEGLVLQSEIMDLRADNEARAEGLVIDTKMEKGLGVVADCIIRWGKLELGDYIVSGVHGGRVRILNDVNNKSIKRANPSQPVRIVGLKTLPKAGDPIVCVQSEEMAKEIISRREALDAQENYRAESSDAPLDVEIVGGASKKGFMANNILKKYGLGEDINDNDEVEKETEGDDVIRIPIILKANADGSLAALRDTLLAIQYESKLNLCIDPISLGIGHVTSSDVSMAAESGAGIFCFNLKGSKDKAAMSLAAAEGVEIRSHDVIYHLLDQAKELFSSYCPETPIDRVHGKGTVKAVFDINNNKNAEKIAGLMVEEGFFFSDKSSKETGSLECHYRVRRGGKVISPDDGVRAKSLRRVKEEVSSVRRGEECGLNLLEFFDVQEGDTIECFSTEMRRIFV